MLKKLPFAVLALSLLLAVGIASAITYGQPDGELHRGVGAVVYFSRSTGLPVPVCSGALISPTVFLTAAHCNLNYIFGSNDVWVSFDTDLSEDAINAGDYTLYPGTFINDPRYTQRQDDAHDLAVIVLNRAVRGRPIYQLPRLGQFDGLVQGQQFTSVGYGAQEPIQIIGSGVVNSYLDVREYSVSSLSALNKAWLRLSQNAATGDAGTCFGDSGGPNFLGAGAGETPIIAGTTITGDMVCRSTNVIYRLDTVAARQFLGQFVSLP
jgi:hypothetical protein